MKIFRVLKINFNLKNFNLKNLKNNCFKIIIAILIFSFGISGVLYKYLKNNTSAVSNDVNNMVDIEPFGPQNLFINPVAESKTIVNNSYFDDVVFVGDSVTNGIKLYKTAKNALVVSKTGLNLEIINNPIEIDGEMISILDYIKKSGRKKIYVMLGSNGIGWLENSYMMKLYSEWINKLKQEVPDALIFIQSVLPITKELSDLNLNQENKLTNQKIADYNVALQEMCKQNKVYFLDVAQEFKNQDNALPDDASPVDGMHISATYYNLWLEYIKSHTVS